jgi:TonB-linked SusC/RagA family outer membrane protein
MKKKQERCLGGYCIHLRKTIKIMKLSLLLLTIGLYNLSASVYSQAVKFDLFQQNVTLKEIFASIEKETSYKFLYRSDLVNINSLTSINEKESTLEEVLSKVLSGTNIGYSIINHNLIVLTPSENAAQKITVKGSVKDKDGNPLAGVNIIIKGTTTGVISDLDGNYSIDVPSAEATLVYTFIGYLPEEVVVGNQKEINMMLVDDVKQLNEIVVTALGIKREAKSLGYSVTSVKSDELAANKSTGAMEALEGKVAGLNISLAAAGIGGSTQIRLRGQVAFSGANNAPLLVINGLPMDQDARGANGSTMRDLGDNMNNINPDDIESMSILKGATAAAIYGSRAANGAIIITTKSGQKTQNLGVEFSSSYTMQEALDYFEPQQVYGQGRFGVKPTSASDATTTGQYGWGAKMDGSLTPIFDGTEQPYKYYPHRLLDYFQTGKILTNTVAVSGGGKGGSFRASYSNTDASGIEPTNKYKRNVFNIGVNQDITKKLKFSTNINYTKEDYINPPQVGQQGAGSMNFFTRLSNSIPISALKNSATNPATGTERQTSGFQGTVLNPYYSQSAGASYVNTRDRFLGTSTLRYDITDWLYAQGRYNYDYYVSFIENKTPGGIGTSVATNADGTYKGSYSQTEARGTNINGDFLVGASKRLNKFTVDASVGGNTARSVYRYYDETVTNFVVRDFFSISNGTLKTPTSNYNKTRVNSLYGIAEFGYNSMFYLNFTGRNDWFSVLNPDNNSKFYSSVSGSFIFSELLRNQDWISYGKLRGSWAQVGSSNGVGAYDGRLTYSIDSKQFNGQTTAVISGSAAPNPNLEPFTVTEKEIGVEARLFDNRLHIDLGYFNKVTTDQIVDVQISETSGYSTSKQNLGSLKNSGVEMLFEYTPVNTNNFKWETSWNNTYLKTEVLSVGKNPDGSSVKDLLVINFNNTGNEFLGELHYTVGMAMNQLYTKTYARNDKGEILLTDAGKLIASDKYVPVGSSIPKYTGGWNNTFSYKKLSLGVFIDYKFGGTVLSSTYLNMTRQGLSDLSLEGRREGENGLVFPGVYKSSGQPNTTAVTDLQGFYADYRNLQIGDPFTFKSDFVKLRTLSLSYNFSDAIKKVDFFKFVKGLSLGVSCRNVFILYKDLPNLDPEAMQSSGDVRAGYENSSLLTTRNYMFSLNVKF